MRDLNPCIQIQPILEQQIRKALQGDVVDAVRKQCDECGCDALFRSEREGHSVKVSPKLLPDIYALCQQVKDTLGFNEEVDFYITNNPTANACAYMTFNEKRPHIIELNSALFNLMTDEELKYILGHELGHLINHDRGVRDLFNFVYPDGEAVQACPTFLRKRMDLYQMIAELGADRYGYMANEDLDACITAIFKMSSGLRLEGREVSVASILQENSEHLQFFLNEEGVSEGTHPVNPMRIWAIQLFATAKTQSALTNGMVEIVGALQRFIYYELDSVLADFVAAAGLKMACADGRRDKSEDEMILNTLAQFALFPAKKLREVEKGDVAQIFKDSLQKLKREGPGLASNLMTYLMDIAFADGILDAKEVDVLYEIGRKLGFSDLDTAEMLADKIRTSLRPRAALMK